MKVEASPEHSGWRLPVFRLTVNDIVPREASFFFKIKTKKHPPQVRRMFSFQFSQMRINIKVSQKPYASIILLKLIDLFNAYMTGAPIAMTPNSPRAVVK